MIGKRMTGEDHRFLFDANKYCSNHGGRAPEAGGEWLVTNNGKSRRWLCAACAERRKAK